MRDNRRSAPPPRCRDGAARRGADAGAAADRSAIDGLAAVLVVAGGAVALNNRDDRTNPEPIETPTPTPVPTPSPSPDAEPILSVAMNALQWHAPSKKE